MSQLSEILTTSLVTSVIIAGVLFLLKEKIKAYLQYSTKFTYDKSLEDFKSQELKRHKAVLIAELISEWISFPDDSKRLNQLTLEAFIWLPKETAKKLSNLLAHTKEAPNVREVIAEVRTIILGKDENIEANEIVFFPRKIIEQEKANG